MKMTKLIRRISSGAFLGGMACGMVAGCSSAPIPPPYTQAELKAMCERRGGWWHDDRLMGGFCEYQAADLQAP